MRGSQTSQKKRVNSNKIEEQQKFSLYLLLELDRKATPDDIVTIIRLRENNTKNKNQGDLCARDKFQKLKEAYDILSNPEKKQIYDETGTIQGNFDQKAFQTAYEYFRSLHKKIEKADIQSFEVEYRFKEMEEEDLIEFYEKHSGNMTELLESIPFSNNEDVPRFIKFFESKIEAKELKKCKLFDQTKKKVRLLVDESEQAEQEKRKKDESMSNLVLAIRQKANTSYLDALEQKYGKPKKKPIEKPSKLKQSKPAGRRK